MAMCNIQVGHAPRVPQPHRLNVEILRLDVIRQEGVPGMDVLSS